MLDIRNNEIKDSVQNNVEMLIGFEMNVYKYKYSLTTSRSNPVLIPFVFLETNCILWLNLLNGGGGGLEVNRLW